MGPEPPEGAEPDELARRLAVDLSLRESDEGKQMEADLKLMKKISAAATAVDTAIGDAYKLIDSLIAESDRGIVEHVSYIEAARKDHDRAAWLTEEYKKMPKTYDMRVQAAKKIADQNAALDSQARNTALATKFMENLDRISDKMAVVDHKIDVALNENRKRYEHIDVLHMRIWRASRETSSGAETAKEAKRVHMLSQQQSSGRMKKVPRVADPVRGTGARSRR
jgi:hypothetical protein